MRRKNGPHSRTSGALTPGPHEGRGPALSLATRRLLILWQQASLSGSDQSPACLWEKRPRFLGAYKPLSYRQPARTFPPRPLQQDWSGGTPPWPLLRGHVGTPSNSGAFTTPNPNRAPPGADPGEKDFPPSPIPRLISELREGPPRPHQEPPETKAATGITGKPPGTLRHGHM